MQPFTFTLDEIDALGSGHGSEQTVAKLIAGQLAKRRLLVWGVVRDARAAGLNVEPAVDLLVRVHERDPETLTDVLAHPQVDAWAAAFREGPEALGYLHALVAVAAMRAGLPFELMVPPAAGSVTLPGLGLLSSDGTPVDLSFDGDNLTVDGLTGSWRPSNKIDLTGSGGPAVLIEDADQYRSLYGLPAAEEPAETDRFAGLWRDAWELLAREHPAHARAARVILRSFVPLVPAEDGMPHSSSNGRAFGAIALTPPPSAEMLALLVVHETQHLKLSALTDLIDLDKGPSESRYRAPWRGDPRPFRSLLQGTYAHLAVTEFWRGRDGRQFAYWCLQTRRSAELLAQSGELTRAGARFVGAMQQTLDRWEREPVAAADLHIAEVCVLVSEVVWQLRHRSTPAADLAALVSAWRRGSSPPAVTASIEHTAPFAEARIVRAVRSHQPALPEGDHALLAGDVSLAAEHYARHIVAGTADDDDWAGLIMALGSSPRPELARDAYRALAGVGAAPRPHDVIRWSARAG